ncbi:MAG: S41 family peptidase [Bdellovibrionales bacterium]
MLYKLLLLLLLALASAAQADLCDSALMAKKRPLTRFQQLRVEQEQQWRGTGLNFEALFEWGFYSQELCSESPEAAVQCLTFLDALARTGRPNSYALIPEGALKAYADEIIKSKKVLGPFRLVQVNPDWVAPPEKGQTKNIQQLNRQRASFLNHARRIAKREEIDFMALLERIGRLVLEPKSQASQIADAINTTLRLDDSHAHIVSSDAIFSDAKRDGESSWGGIGISQSPTKSGFRIMGVLQNTPAAQADLQIGDEIIEVDGLNSHTHGLIAMNRQLEGRVGATVHLLIRRHRQTFELTLKRELIEQRNVEAQLVFNAYRTSSYGHLILRSFANTSGCRNLKRKIISLAKKGAQGLILDLRGNIGGLRSQAQCIAGLFLGKKIVAYEVDLETGKRVPLYGHEKKMTNLPLVVLLNGQSASASEFVGGALRDHHRAWIMGERSFGKGSVQTIKGFFVSPSETSLIHLFTTTARFDQPGGTSNQVVGIEPQFFAPIIPGGNETDVAREALLYQNIPAPVSKRWREDRPAEVKQLNKCLDERGYADAIFLEMRSNAGPYADYQLLKAIDLLDCMNY